MPRSWFILESFPQHGKHWREKLSLLAHFAHRPSRRPPAPREPLPEDLNLFEPEEPFELDFDRLARNLRNARRGAPGGPSGMTAEHLRPLLENDRDIAKLCDFASIMVPKKVPNRIEPAVRLGRITALQKLGGGVRGIVVSDFLRRAVARTMVQQVSNFTTLVGVLPEAISESARAAATLPLSSGGLVCRSSVRLRHAAHWASWADSIKMIGERHPEVAATILRAVDDNNGSRSIKAINSCTQRLEEAGFVVPDCVQLASGEVQAPDVVDKEEPNQPRKGWQAAVSRVVETQFWDGLLPTLSNRDATLLRSQPGPLASIPFTVFFPRIVRAGSTRSLSAFCCSAGRASHSLSLRVRACVAVSSTTWATIARLAQLLGSLDEGDIVWRLLRSASPEKQVEGCGLTCSCGS